MNEFNTTLNKAFQAQKNNNIKLANNLYKKAIKLNTNITDINYNIAYTYELLDKYKKAIKYYKKAINSNNKTLAYNNLAMIYQNKQKYKKAIKYHEKAILSNKKNPYIYTNYAITLIKDQQYKKGYNYLEYRWYLPQYKALISKLDNKKKWSTQSLENKILLITLEQGFGDNIQFIRLASILKKEYKNITIIIQTREELKTLFSTITFIDQVITLDDSLPSYDYYIPLISLLKILNITNINIPQEAIFQITKETLPTINHKKKIGIVWNGTSHQHLKLKDFQTLFQQNRYNIYSFQIGNKKELDICKYSNNIVDMANNINDFYDTAKYLLDLDILLTTDTAIAHLAGTLGIKTVVILPKYNIHYMWFLNDLKSPWYKSLNFYINIKNKQISKIVDHLI